MRFEKVHCYWGSGAIPAALGYRRLARQLIVVIRLYWSPQTAQLLDTQSWEHVDPCHNCHLINNCSPYLSSEIQSFL